jgi:leader peptidase (prepilin peptidase)/N-methyltransferase
MEWLHAPVLANPPMNLDSIASWELWLSPITLGVLGLLVGSFLNVVIYRLPVMMERGWWDEIAGQLDDAPTWKRVLGLDRPAAYDRAGIDIDAALTALPPLGLATPRSRCGHCGHEIAWYENLPVVSWLALRARCSSCKTPIAARYPLVELATGALFAGAAWRFGPTPVTLAWCAVLALLVAMAMIDWDTTLLPDSMTLPMLWGGLVVAALGLNLPLATAIWGAVVGYLSLWSIYWLFKLTTGKEGMGAGDFKLLAALGAWLGWQAILPIALMASIVGLVVSLPLKASGKLKDGQAIPFGPFLAGGGLVVIFVGVERCLEWIGIR